MPATAVPLPPAFTSLYRIFLRSTATAVLDDSHGTQTLRFIYRPMFREAAAVIRRLQASDGMPSHERNKLQIWLSHWQRRADQTLSFLSISSQRRGLPHQVTRNLGKVVRSLKQSNRLGPVSRQGSAWDPKNPHRARERLDALGPDHQVVQQRMFQNEVLGAMGEAIRLAEGRSDIFLGRISTKLPL